jgi:ABC-type transport system involved in cytochrome c biogenesis permease subunit
MERLSVTLATAAAIGYGIAFCAAVASLLLRPRGGLAYGPAAIGAVALVIQMTAFGVRWVAAGYAPVLGLHETLLVFSIATALAFLFVGLRHRFLHRPHFPLLFCGAIAGASLLPKKTLAPLIPILDTPLFSWHVIVSFCAYGCAAFGAAVVLDRLIGPGKERRSFPYDRLLREINFLFFVFFSLCMIIGGIWAFLAWGSYWSWNSKGIWSGALWLYYAAIVHLPYQGKWRGGRITAVSAIGFLLVMMTFLGVGLLMRSNHPLE